MEIPSTPWRSAPWPLGEALEESPFEAVWEPLAGQVRHTFTHFHLRLTVVTAAYQTGALSGVIGVIGPTRMPYEKVVALVRHTSMLVSDLLD